MSKKRYRYRNAVDRDATSQGRITSDQAICSVFNSILVVSSMIRPARPLMAYLPLLFSRLIRLSGCST